MKNIQSITSITLTSISIMLLLLIGFLFVGCGYQIQDSRCGETYSRCINRAFGRQYVNDKEVEDRLNWLEANICKYSTLKDANNAYRRWNELYLNKMTENFYECMENDCSGKDKQWIEDIIEKQKRKTLQDVNLQFQWMKEVDARWKNCKEMQ